MFDLCRGYCSDHQASNNGLASISGRGILRATSCGRYCGGGHSEPMCAPRLIADDLTGALDAAAEFIGMAGPIRAYWAGAIPPELPAAAALDSGTREQGEDDAVAIIGRLAPALASAGLAFKKLDSLLRGNTMAEIAACVRLGSWQYSVVAPAFPYQGRITRGGRQFARGPDGWSAASNDIVAALAGSCPRAWCRDTGPRQGSRVGQAATAGSLRMGSSLKQASDSRLM